MSEAKIREIQVSLSEEEVGCLLMCLETVSSQLPDPGDDEETVYARELMWLLDQKLRKALAADVEV